MLPKLPKNQTMTLEELMNEFVEKLNLPLEVTYVPDSKSSKHAEIKERVILVYDTDEETAWTSLLHELIEYRLRTVTSTYRRLTNKLIEFAEAEVYAKKELTIEQIIRDFETWRTQRKSS